ncbi:hypothetical protein HFN89_06875 [Rhizobium laguerreae]|nr:hypothetical protein [Rhizobium laguerreae]
MDKAYFVDLLAGRKKTVSAIAFMLAARRLGLDPWELAGVERPVATSVPVTPDRTPLPSVAPVDTPAPLPRVKGCGVVEEGAFRAAGRANPMRSFPVVEGYQVDRQFVVEVRGHDYVSWGLPSGAVVHAVSFPRYETVVGPGRLVVASRTLENLVETVLRRVWVDGEGEMRLLAPNGAKDIPGDHGVRLDGLVVQSALPPILP